jgi:hypothetical protein
MADLIRLTGLWKSKGRPAKGKSYDRHRTNI